MVNYISSGCGVSKMDKKQIVDRARRLEGAMRSLKHMKFLTSDCSGLKDSEKYSLWMLATLNNGNPVTPSEAAKKLNVTLAAITHNINALEKQELVSRSTSPDDRRVILISLSEKGLRIVEGLKRSYFKKFCDLVEHLGDGDSAELLRLTDKIKEHLRAIKDKDAEIS